MNQLKLPIWSQEAEQSILAYLLTTNNQAKIIEVLEMVKVDMFYHKSHRDIYKAMLSVQPDMNIVLIHSKLNNSNIEFDYLQSLAEITHISNVEPYLTILIDKHTKRGILELTERLNEDLHDNKNIANDLIVEYANNLNKLQHDKVSYNVCDIKGIVDNIQNTFNKPTVYMKSTDKQLNKLLARKFYQNGEYEEGGFTRGQLVVMAGKSGMGKTATALHLFSSLSVDNNCLFFSLEMSADELSTRIFNSYSQNQELTPDALDKFTNQISLRSNMEIIDDAKINIMKLKKYILDYKLKHSELDVIVIDYLQIMDRPSGMKEYEFLCETTRALKQIARENEIVIICLSQLNRGGTERKEKRPILADLRGSGSIEADADMVIFLHREEWYYAERGEECPAEVKGILEFIIAKYRQGSPKKGIYNINLSLSSLHECDEFTKRKYMDFLKGV